MLEISSKLDNSLIELCKKTQCSFFKYSAVKQTRKTRMWANAQPDDRPADISWRPLFNAATFG